MLEILERKKNKNEKKQEWNDVGNFLVSINICGHKIVM